MHILSQTNYFEALQREEKVFLETWYNLTHERSLDSFRVRCHNGRTILEELRREMGYSFANAEDISMIVAEAKQICSKDIVLQKILGRSWPVLESLLASMAAKANKDDSGKEKQQLGYILTDILPDLPDAYLAGTITATEAAIAGNQDAEIVRLANCLATDLAARGWAVASLHTWIETRFLAEPWASKNFAERFRIFAERMKRCPQPYNVVLSLSGSRDLQALGGFGGFQFSENPPTIEQPNHLKIEHSLAKFLRPNRQRTFASTTVKAVDQYSAVHAAQEKFAKCQDRLRFNFCPDPVVSWRAVFVSRQSDQKHRIVPVLVRVPNPEHHLKMVDFVTANGKLDKLFESGQLNMESRRRIEAAVRHYRLGLDGHAYRDMLLNWWMGLETLTSTGDGKGIGVKVVKNSIPLLTQRYFVMQLRYLSTVVCAACGQWPQEVQCLFGVQLTEALLWQQMITVLQDNTTASAVEVAIAQHPWLQHYWNRFRQIVSAPEKLAEYLNEHEQRVHWHLYRLYRTRCCLIHGTPVDTPLQLPTANLEYYLREAIHLVIDALTQAKQITSLEALFERAQYCSSRRNSILRAKDAKHASVQAALESEIVFQIST